MTVDGLAFAFEVGGVEVPAWLPLLPQRYALESAYRAALGFVDGDQGVPSLEPNESDFGAVLAAAVALCWGGPVLELVRYTDTGPTVVRVPPGPRGPEGTLVLRGGRVLDGTGRPAAATPSA